MKQTKVSLYVRNRSTRQYQKATNRKIYPIGTIYVLRYGKTWETLPGSLSHTEAQVKMLQRQIDFQQGKMRQSPPKPPKQESLLMLDQAVDSYLAEIHSGRKKRPTKHMPSHSSTFLRVAATSR
jgi:hypothetical protein